MRRFVPWLLLLLASPAAASPEHARSLVGTKAPGWGPELRWLDRARGPAWEKLRGRVVLVRWWTGPDCNYCKNTAPVLRRFARRYGERGLVVLGMFHPKPRARAVSDDEARARAAEKKLRFPIAIDADWAVLDKWWLRGRTRGFTSVTFLVDARGVIRWVHPGGEFHDESGRHIGKSKPVERCAAEYREAVRMIEKLLPE